MNRKVKSPISAPVIIVCLLATAWWLWQDPPATAFQPPPAEQQAADQQQGDRQRGDRQRADDNGLGGLLDGLDLEPETANPPAADSAAPQNPAQPSSDKSKANQSAQENSGIPLWQAYLAMRDAGQRLSRGQVDEDTLSSQQRAIDLLDEIINTASSDEPTGAAQSQQPSQQQPDQQQTDQQSDQQPAGEPQQDPDAQQDPQPGESTTEQSEQSEQSAQAEQGSEQQTEGPGQSEGEQTPTGEGDGSAAGDDGQATEQEAAMAARAGQAPPLAEGQAVWGHLPQRTRGLLRADIPTEYVPRYAKAIRAYFEALAELPANE